MFCLRHGDPGKRWLAFLANHRNGYGFSGTRSEAPWNVRREEESSIAAHESVLGEASEERG
jgi:hypothetical protein